MRKSAMSHFTIADGIAQLEEVAENLRQFADEARRKRIASAYLAMKIAEGSVVIDSVNPSHVSWDALLDEIEHLAGQPNTPARHIERLKVAHQKVILKLVNIDECVGVI